MIRKFTKHLFGLAAVCLVLAASAASQMSVPVSKGEIVPGEWNENFQAGMAYAEANHLPLVVFWAKNGCSMCEKLEKAVAEPEFIEYQKNSGYVYIYHLGGDGTDPVKDFARNPSGDYPYCVVYQKKADGSTIINRFTGRNGKMPSNEGKKLWEKFRNSIELVVTGQTPSGGSSVNPKSVPTVWQKSRTLYGVVYTAENPVAGVIEVKLGKASKKTFEAKVSVSVSLISGAKKKISGKVNVLDTTAVILQSGSFGTLRMELNEWGYTGTIQSPALGNYDIESTLIGGALEKGSLFLHLLSWPTVCDGQPVLTDFLPKEFAFDCQGTKWKMPTKGNVKWDRNAKAFVATRAENPAGVKLTYTSKSGLFKGTYYSYVQRGETKVKKVSTKVTGYVVNGIGYGIATGKGLEDAYLQIDQENPAQ